MYNHRMKHFHMRDIIVPLGLAISGGLAAAAANEASCLHDDEVNNQSHSQEMVSKIIDRNRGGHFAMLLGTSVGLAAGAACAVQKIEE